MEYFCYLCGTNYDPNELLWRCSCGGYLNSRGTSLLRREDIIKERPSLWRYEKALPLTLSEAATNYQEGFTPLVKNHWAGRKVLFKVDYLMPTGSFKDRGNAILVNFLQARGVKKVVEDSSGNAGASIAAYCAAADMECDIYVPATSSAGKLVQIAVYGARLHKVSGSREDVAAEAHKAGEVDFYASHNWHPLFVEGTKTLAYEIWEQMGYQVPENIVVPVGMGSSLLGLAKGFRELSEAGEIDKVPRLYAVQAKNCAPLYDLFKGTNTAVSPTIAEGVACARLVRAAELVRVVTDSGGVVEIASEEEIIEALKGIAALGYYIEPTSAVALAGATRLIQASVIPEDGEVVILLTGSGLKATDKISEVY